MLNKIFELKFADLLFIGPLISQLAFRTKDFARYLLSTSERFVSNTFEKYVFLLSHFFTIPWKQIHLLRYSNILAYSVKTQVFRHQILKVESFKFIIRIKYKNHIKIIKSKLIFWWSQWNSEIISIKYF